MDRSAQFETDLDDITTGTNTGTPTTASNCLYYINSVQFFVRRILNMFLGLNMFQL